jgi:hypothetical protein
LRDLMSGFGIGRGRYEARVEGHIAGNSRVEPQRRGGWEGRPGVVEAEETKSRGPVAMSIGVVEDGRGRGGD